MTDPRIPPQDVDRASAVEIAPYLRSTGWLQIQTRERFDVWARPRRDDTLRVVLPKDATAEDFAQRNVEALMVLAFAEDRTLPEVLADVEAGGADVISVRLDTSAPSGQAPLAVAEEAVSALKAFVVGAAAGLEVGTAVLPPRRPRAERYAARARLSTGVGSFILTVAMPLYEGRPEADLAAGQTAMDEFLEVPAVPYGRQVAARMRSVTESAVGLARQVYEGSDDVTAFDTDPGTTGNATELEALARLGGGLVHEYRIRFTSSPVVPATLPEPAIVTVTPREQQVLGQAAELLRERKPKDDVTVVGTVVRLARDAGLGPGEVVVRGVELGTGGAHRYRAYLSEDQYRQAILAHERGLQVAVRGSLVVRGTFLILEALRWFSVQQELPQEPETLD
jgi:hypothetical protein